MITARSQYDERLPVASDLSFEGDKGVTKQSDLKDCDLNVMFKRFEKTGQLPDLIAKNGRYGDFSEVPDYQEAVSIVRLAEEQFMALDAHLRNRFENNPAKFLEFATDPKNLDEIEKMGLLKPEALAARNAERESKNAEIKAQYEALAAKAEKDLIARIKAELAKPA